MPEAAMQESFEGRYTLPIVETVADTAEEIHRKQERVRALCKERNAVLLAGRAETCLALGHLLAEAGFVEAAIESFTRAEAPDRAAINYIAPPACINQVEFLHAILRGLACLPPAGLRHIRGTDAAQDRPHRRRKGQGPSQRDARVRALGTPA